MNNFENPEVYLAQQFALHTAKSLFVSGRAGTGKTTFLKSIVSAGFKKIAVAAPTGIAAINAGGVTLHSLFQLPLGSYSTANTAASSFFTKNMLLSSLRMNEDKLRLIRELELLVIDEVSMLRCDILDAVDVVLRHVRYQKNKPFGGLQLLFIGDLQQLPPVVNQQEWQHLSTLYNTPFFFSAQAFQAISVHYIELKKIYRQTDKVFIELLENVRDNKLSETDVELLNSRYQNELQHDLGTITLTTHNHKADAINKKELDKISGTAFTYNGKLTGEFQERNIPVDSPLVLKEGAQVMFVKNDNHADKRYFNGKIGIVKSLKEGEILVEFADDGTTVVVEKETWKTIKYSHNIEEDKIEEQELGSYTQYPLKLAWAITIHKSQGLTFDKVLIDAEDAFAAGQVYVALSRCRSLAGITLTTLINKSAIQTDSRLIELSSHQKSNHDLDDELTIAKKHYARTQSIKRFMFDRELGLLVDFEKYTADKKFSDKEMTQAVLAELLKRLSNLKDTGDKFIVQLNDFFEANTHDSDWLKDRLGKGIAYFSTAWHKEIIQPIQAHYLYLKPKKGVKQYFNKLSELEELFWAKLNQIQQLQYGDYNFSSFHQTIVRGQPAPKKDKLVKGETFNETLKLFKEGKSIAEITQIRDMVISTIEGHLSRFVGLGELAIVDVLSKTKIDHIITIAHQKGIANSKDIKEALGDDYSYGEIKLVQAHLQWMSGAAEVIRN
jgi:hypothetical protein